MSFGSYLKEKRETSGLTTIEIAQRMKITQSYVSQLENDFRFPSQKQLPHLAKAYGIPEEEMRHHWTEGKMRSVSFGREYKFNVKDVGHKVPLLDSIKPIDDLEVRLEEARKFYSIPKDDVPTGHRLFGLRANGLQLVDAGILPGDLLIVDIDATPENGDIVIISTQDGVAMTYLHKQGEFLEMRPVFDGFKKTYHLNESKVVGRLVCHIKKY